MIYAYNTRGARGNGARRYEPRRAETRRSQPNINVTSTGLCRNTLFRGHARARQTRRVAVATAASVKFRFINKNPAVGSVEMAAVARDTGVGVEQPVPRTPLDVYRESHHLLALGRSIAMRSSLKHETWDKRGTHLRVYMDFLGVSLPLSFAFYSSLFRNVVPILDYRFFFRRNRSYV